MSISETNIEEMPFQIQRIQTDPGREFSAYKFQERLKKQRIKFQLIKAHSPHLNGEVKCPHNKPIRKNFIEVFNLQILEEKKLHAP